MTYYIAAATEESHATDTVGQAETHTTQETTQSAETGAEHSEGGILGLSASAFVIQLVTFIFVFALLKKFAFNRIVRMLDERHKTIDDGVRMGLRMEEEKAKLDEDVAKTLRGARAEADDIIAAAQKESRETVREAEKAGQRKVDSMIADAEVRIEEDAKHARDRLEKELVGLVSEATETVVGEKVDARKDAELVKKAMKGRKN
ncbi:F0F1 ATP synthase subunit B [Candidatus Saccharibacteria bacterium]|nr:F0F1 ATP synthase subunit B [Candidatus Saccharibacteria bacterium]